MRFTAGIPAYPALFRTRNGRGECDVRFAAEKQTNSAKPWTRNGSRTCYIRFAARITADPALFRTRNGRQTCHIGFTDGKQTDSVRTRTRNGCGKCKV